MNLYRNNTTKLGIKETLFILLLFFLWSRCLSIKYFSMEYSGIDYSMLSVCFILLLVNFYYCFVKKKNFIHSFYTKALICLLFIVLIPIAVSSVMVLNQPITALLKRPFFFISYLIFPLLVYLNFEDHDIFRLFNVLMFFTLAACTLVILGFFLPDVRSWFVEGIVASRYERVRLGTQVLPNLTRLLFFYCVVLSFKGWSTKLRRLSVLFSFLLFWMVAFVWGTRQIVISFILTLLFYWVFHLRPNEKIRSFATVFAVIVLSYSLIETSQVGDSLEYLERLIGSIKEEATELSGTIGVRAQGLSYYFDQFSKSNYIGFGMISTTEGIENPLYVGLKEYGYNLNDIGVFGMVFRFGLPVVVFLVVVFYRMLRDLNYAKNVCFYKLLPIVESLKLFIISEIVAFPFSKAFFFQKFAMFYGLVMFYVWRLTKVKVKASDGLKG